MKYGLTIFDKRSLKNTLIFLGVCIFQLLLFYKISIDYIPILLIIGFSFQLAQVSLPLVLQEFYKNYKDKYLAIYVGLALFIFHAFKLMHSSLTKILILQEPNIHVDTREFNALLIGLFCTVCLLILSAPKKIKNNIQITHHENENHFSNN